MSSSSGTKGLKQCNPRALIKYLARPHTLDSMVGASFHRGGPRNSMTMQKKHKMLPIYNIPNCVVHANTTEKGVRSERCRKNLNEKLALVLLDGSAKEDLVTKHPKQAKEVTTDSALKECMRQLSLAQEEHVNPQGMDSRHLLISLRCMYLIWLTREVL